MISKPNFCDGGPGRNRTSFAIQRLKERCGRFRTFVLLRLFCLLPAPALWSILAVTFLIIGIAALIHFGPIQIWGWLGFYACWWCFKKFAGAI